jgi:outer membrane protein, heavy metal efflux system
VYVLFQAYTFQDNAPIHLKSSTSWAVGAAVALPVFNRNQGNILRAEINADQTRLELDDWEKRVRLEVKKAVGEYAITLQEVVVHRDVISENARKLFEMQTKGGRHPVGTPDYAEDVDQYNQASRATVEARVKHRLSMLQLNTAVGAKVLP